MKKYSSFQVGFVAASRPRPQLTLRQRLYPLTRRLAYFWSGQAPMTRRDVIDAWVATIGATGTGAGLIGCAIEAVLK